MTTIVTRSGKGSSLSWVEADANFTNLNNDKLETSTVGVTVQPHSSNLDSFATVAPTAAGLALLDDVDATAQRTTLGLGNVDNTSDATKNTATVTLTNKTLTTPILTSPQIGNSGTATQNFTITSAAADGTMKLARGNSGATTQDVITVDVNGKVSIPQGGAQFPKAFCIFDGTATGTNAPLAGFGITSVTRNSVGNYTINLSATYADNFYIVNVTADNGAINQCYWASANTTSVTVANYVAGVLTNATRLHVTVWRAS